MEDTPRPGGQKLYFLSDFHLGIPDYQSSLKREKLLVSWLEMISPDAAEIFLMGDVFDFWFEYKTVVPKGYIRLLGALARITDRGIPVHLYCGNHDIWAFDYLDKEIGIQLHRHPETRTMMGKEFYLAHGDGLGPGDKGYKILKKVFRSRFNQYLFRWLHPDIGAKMGLYFSRKSRLANVVKENKKEDLNSVENEMLYKYAKRLLENGIRADYFIFGHRHRPLDVVLDKGSRLILLGDWLTNFTYAEFYNGNIKLKNYKNEPL
jgi:UDP-2,3-diacylglucosamine hydrolase